ncbi:sirohydrochlorin chelatase [Planctomicrobium sp. SH527]|uniref:sirohydrochlorin chelatase n=1 Tax=Planctomicrobium sp. SH527 TaxID=3448123 RepID=UPI003F5CBC7A
MNSAILLIAHGSRRAEANADLVKVAELLRPLISDPIIEIAYLELAEPSIPDGLQRCVERGATEIRILPYFLSAGSHVAEDLRRFQHDFNREHPGVTCQLSPPLGLHAGVIAALAARLQEDL